MTFLLNQLMSSLSDIQLLSQKVATVTVVMTKKEKSAQVFENNLLTCLEIHYLLSQVHNYIYCVIYMALCMYVYLSI